MGSHHASGPCHRCGRSGHLARECSLHICFRCNGRGHMAWECVEGVTCSRCGERGHLQRNCKNVSCHKCGRKGHISKFCNDPFMKAEEAERHERQQALLKSRNTSSEGGGKGGLASSTKSVAPAGNQRGAPGPWDGLGNSGPDRMFPEKSSSNIGLAIGKLVTNRVGGAMSGKVNILTVKRKIYPEANIEGAKRQAHQRCGDQDADLGGDFVETIPKIDTLKDEEPPQWNGLLGYGSEESRDEGCNSSDIDSVEQNCSFEGHVQLKLKGSVDEVNGSASPLQVSVDEVKGSGITLQSSVEEELVKETTLVCQEIALGGALQLAEISKEML